MVYAYRLVYPPNPSAPEQLWEWRQLYIDHLVWNAWTFGRQLMQRYFASWEALERENTHLWETGYRPARLLCVVDHLAAWLAEYRELLVITREVYEMHHSHSSLWPLSCARSPYVLLPCDAQPPFR
jgi:hypothetical protein